jgi:DNA-binding LacI/PurR family transcriptional regulator
MSGRDEKMGHSGGTKNILMADIAAQAGVSVSTVSRVLSGKSKDTTKKGRMIKNLVRKNGYEVNRHAQMLRGTNNAVRMGLSINLSTDLNTQLCGGITKEILRQTRHYFPSIDISFSHSSDQDVDGLANLASIEQIAPKECTVDRAGTSNAAVFLRAATTCETENENGDVLLDFKHALRQASQHLVGCGVRSILFVGENGCPYQKIFEDDWDEFSASIKPLSSFRHIIAQTTPVVAPFSCADLDAVLDDVDGIIAGSTIAAFAIMAELDVMGLQVPKDIKVVVMEETNLFAYTKPSLTSISFEFDRAISLMLELFSQKRNGLNPRSEVLQARLTRRASSGFLSHGEI